MVSLVLLSLLDNLPLLEITLSLEMVSDADFFPHSWQILTFVCLTPQWASSLSFKENCYFMVSIFSL